ncbi:MAG: DUF928 domain-containing protein [Leptolyngbyaceae cyanobacterium bins.302]|nr:DUF928 domain-containing protein [Leptolyngbyaceae cyanobacterium bins.302]
MKHQRLAGTLGTIALVVSSVGTLGSAHAITFTPPPNKGTPSQATGGASRGTVNFLPPARQGTPTQTTGGASRGNLFVPAAGSGAPTQTTGGASRNGIFTPAAGNSTPKQTTGGASRNPSFTPASGNGAPRQAAAGASRQGTYSLNPSIVGAGGPAAIMALLPQSYMGMTVSAHPTILVYLPVSTAKEMVFSLKDEAGNLQHQMTLPAPGISGIVAVKLPETVTPLEIGKNYQWFLALKVNGELNPSTPYVDGWVQRIQPDAALATALQDPNLLKRAAALGAKGVWYDCVAIMAMLRTTQSGSEALAKDWADLLASVGLQEVAKAAIVLPTN